MNYRIWILCFLGVLGMGQGKFLKAQSLAFSQVYVFNSNDGVQTVPANKVWKIENVNGGSGQITVTGASNWNCGTTCSGGSCANSSCSYVGYIWELNGTPIDPFPDVMPVRVELATIHWRIALRVLLTTWEPFLPFIHRFG